MKNKKQKKNKQKIKKKNKKQKKNRDKKDTLARLLYVRTYQTYDGGNFLRMILQIIGNETKKTWLCISRKRQKTM